MADHARIGFVGLGVMGRDLLKEAVSNPAIHVAGLCDLDIPNREKAWDIVEGTTPTYERYSDLFASEEMDGVVIATPQFLHKEIALAAFESGLHVFCEKPLALNVADCEVMIAEARQANRGLMVGQVLRYIGVYRYIIERALSGEMGEPVSARIWRTSTWGNWLLPWRESFDTCGGLLLEVNVHEVDMMACIMGEAQRVYALGASITEGQMDYDDFITVLIEFEGGGIGNLTSSMADHHGKYTGEIIFERGTIYYDSLSAEVRITKEGEETEVLAYDSVHPEWESGTYREIREFAEHCLGQGEVTIPGAEGMRNVEIAEAAYLSVAERRVVDLPLTR
jgi:predicted dehydrogenase